MGCAAIPENPLKEIRDYPSYGAVTETSVGALFMAGVVPGLLLGLVLMVAIYIVARMRNMPRQPRASLGEVSAAARDSIWELLLIVIILGGIYGGVFTPTEAAAVAAVYAFFIASFIAVFVYRDIGMVTPPVGLNLFVTAGITTMSIGGVIRAAMPWLALLLAYLFFITYVPAVSLWLPGLFG